MNKLSEEQALTLMKDDLLDISLDMLTSAFFDDANDVETIRHWIRLTNEVFQSDNFDNLLSLMTEYFVDAPQSESVRMLINWLIGMFVEGRRDNNEH